MELPGVVDLHMHSNVSDGTDSPEELTGLVRRAGIRLFSLTDHDAVSGCGRIRKLTASADISGAGQKEEYPMFVTGVEFSCGDEYGKYHILGYGYDPESEGVMRVVNQGRRYRMKKFFARLSFLRDYFGFSFSETDTERLLKNYNPGKPHIANLMVKYGYAKTKEEAIKRYIDKKHFRSEYVRPEEAIRGILDGGGIPVLAHPTYGDGGQLIMGEEMEKRVLRLMEAGLQGLEAYYSGFSPGMQNELLRYAERFQLYVTAGSDYHGHNKLVRMGDTNLDETRSGAEGLKRFLEEIMRRV